MPEPDPASLRRSRPLLPGGGDPAAAATVRAADEPGGLVLAAGGGPRGPLPLHRGGPLPGPQGAPLEAGAGWAQHLRPGPALPVLLREQGQHQGQLQRPQGKLQLPDSTEARTEHTKLSQFLQGRSTIINNHYTACLVKNLRLDIFK